MQAGVSGKRQAPRKTPREKKKRPCLGVWVSGCLGVWVSGCLGVWVSGCLGVWVSGCLGVWTLHAQPITAMFGVCQQHFAQAAVQSRGQCLCRQFGQIVAFAQMPGQHMPQAAVVQDTR